MPEGPSIVILKELVKPFKGKKVLSANGSAPVDMKLLVNRKITDFKTWGKHFLIITPKINLRVHFLLFGSYSINEKTKAKPKLALEFTNGQLYLYACAVKTIEEKLNDVYDWEGDVMNPKWNAAKARKKLKEIPDTLVCDALLNQDIFSGVGNIIKNEVLFRIKVHPESKLGDIPARKIAEMIKEAKIYSFEFLKWKKKNELKKHWQAHTKKSCPRCDIPLVKKYSGKTKRRTFFCRNCQLKYS